jgi:arginyl-tRNA synthetase
MGIVSDLQAAVSSAINDQFGTSLSATDIQVNETKVEFEGDYTIVLFGFVKQLRLSPEKAGQQIGETLLRNRPDFIRSFNVIKGFLNLSISDSYWLNILTKNFQNSSFGSGTLPSQKIMVEYSSPNTNKPLHLGHLRNNFLGWSIAEILSFAGHDVVKTCIVNDRGVHICKSMVAWLHFGNGATPESTGTKGDHLVGDFYVQFENELRKQAAVLIEQLRNNDFAGIDEADRKKVHSAIQNNSPDEKLNELLNEVARNNSPLMKEVRETLIRWEENDPSTVELWRKMNGWVYEGFDVTYNLIGSDFHKTYYESDTYLLGKQFVEEGLQKGIFVRREDNSVWIDLTEDGLDEKLLLRSDGTSVYITQDLGLAKKKYDDYQMDQSIYVVGDEQNYHMKVLRLICMKLGIPHAEAIHHLSYGMVDLPTGRMKSREGTVVDADDLVAEMIKISAKHTQELGKVNDFSLQELDELYRVLGLGALKFYLLRVDPKKRMVFNPEESIDFHGFTGPFIQYTYARTQSILRKAAPENTDVGEELLLVEKNIIIQLEQFPSVIRQAVDELNPSVIANYVFRLAQQFNSFLTELRVLTAESEAKKELRLQLSSMTVNVIRNCMRLLGIEVPERM